MDSDAIRPEAIDLPRTRRVDITYIVTLMTRDTPNN
jgi:hypothetical protein